MKSGKTWRIGLLAMVVAGLLGVSELKGAPSLIVQSPTSLYLLAEFKLALGDTNSGLELLNRALAGGESPAPPAATVVACNVAAHISNP
ncbi:MAG: hypothetical protein WA463_14840 [Terriglobales bacterium]